ncbi:MAG TPA: DinB family protein [Vicinamibacterales bacterium]|nr:DinB family protein [Vicinamibacterales bacterium]
MSERDSLLPEFDQETAATRRLLERVPDHAFAWRPHPKSFDLGELATHLARLPHWGALILKQDSYDLATSGPRGQALPDIAAVLEQFDANVREVRTALVEMTDGQLLQPWSLRRGDKVLMSVPKVFAVRGFVVRHLVHHRGQMTVYLRMNDVPLPPLYGPTADELT